MMREECSFTSPFIEQSLFGRSWLASFRQPIQADLPREHISSKE